MAACFLLGMQALIMKFLTQVTASSPRGIHGSKPGSNNNSNKTPAVSFYAIPPVRKHEGKETEVPERPVAS